MAEMKSEAVISAMEALASAPVPAAMADSMRRQVDELNLVRSGLDDTMRLAFQQIREVWRSRDDVPDLRTAAYIVAIEKVARYYEEYAL